MREPKQNEFTCDMCRNTYEKEWTDDEAEAEMKEIWGVIPKEDRAIVCDDCFNSIEQNTLKKVSTYLSSNFYETNIEEKPFYNITKWKI